LTSSFSSDLNPPSIGVMFLDIIGFSSPLLFGSFTPGSVSVLFSLFIYSFLTFERGFILYLCPPAAFSSNSFYLRTTRLARLTMWYWTPPVYGPSLTSFFILILLSTTAFSMLFFTISCCFCYKLFLRNWEELCNNYTIFGLLCAFAFFYSWGNS
jgi:hypothetical protein